MIPDPVGRRPGGLAALPPVGDLLGNRLDDVVQLVQDLITARLIGVPHSASSHRCPTLRSSFTGPDTPSPGFADLSRGARWLRNGYPTVPSGASGSLRSRTPQARKMALPMAGAMAIRGVSPAPTDG